MRLLRFLFTTIKGLFTLIGMLVGLAIAAIGAVLLFGPPRCGFRADGAGNEG